MNTSASTNTYRLIPLAIISGAAIIITGFMSETIHLPFLVNILLSLGLGWLAPQKGWILALVQAVSIVVIYLIITQTGMLVAKQADVADFTTYLSIFPTLAGSYMGAFLKRAMS